jgi:hypothetical protein
VHAIGIKSATVRKEQSAGLRIVQPWVTSNSQKISGTKKMAGTIVAQDPMIQSPSEIQANHNLLWPHPLREQPFQAPIHENGND